MNRLLLHVHLKNSLTVFKKKHLALVLTALIFLASFNTGLIHKVRGASVLMFVFDQDGVRQVSSVDSQIDQIVNQYGSAGERAFIPSPVKSNLRIPLGEKNYSYVAFYNNETGSLAIIFLDEDGQVVVDASTIYRLTLLSRIYHGPYLYVFDHSEFAPVRTIPGFFYASNDWADQFEELVNQEQSDIKEAKLIGEVALSNQFVLNIANTVLSIYAKVPLDAKDWTFLAFDELELSYAMVKLWKGGEITKPEIDQLIEEGFRLKEWGERIDVLTDGLAGFYRLYTTYRTISDVAERNRLMRAEAKGLFFTALPYLESFVAPNKQAAEVVADWAMGDTYIAWDYSKMTTILRKITANQASERDIYDFILYDSHRRAMILETLRQVKTDYQAFQSTILGWLAEHLLGGNTLETIDKAITDWENWSCYLRTEYVSLGHEVLEDYTTSYSRLDRMYPARVHVMASVPSQASLATQFDVTAEAWNVGHSDIHNVLVTLTLPAGLHWVSGANPQNLGTIPVAGSVSTSWTAMADSAGNRTVKVDVGCDEGATDDDYRTVHVKEAAELKVTINSLTSNFVGSTFDAAVSIENKASYDLHNVVISIDLPQHLNLVPPPGTPQKIDVLPATKTYVRGWRLNATQENLNPGYTFTVSATCDEGAHAQDQWTIQAFEYKAPTRHWIIDRKVVGEPVIEESPCTATSSDGHLFIAANRLNDITNKYVIAIYESSDKGKSWNKYCEFTWDDSYDSLCKGIALDPYNNYIYVVYEVVVSATHHDIICTVVYPSLSRAHVIVANDSEGGGYYHSPSITVEYQYGNDNHVYIAYEYVESLSNRDLMFASSTDHGDHWSAKKLHGDSDSTLYNCPSITTAEGTVYIAYVHNSNYDPDYAENGRGRVWVDVSGDRGASWAQKQDIDGMAGVAVCTRPVVAATHGGGWAMIAFSILEEDYLDEDICYAYSKDHGGSWTGAMHMPSTARHDVEISLSADGQGTTSNSVFGYFRIAFICVDDRDPMEWDRGCVAYRQCFYNRIDMNNWEPYYGPNWQPIDQSNWNVWASPTTMTTMLQDDGKWYPVVTWTDDRNDNRDIYAATPEKEAPDLIVNDIIWEPSNPVEGNVTTVTCFVENQGLANASSFEVQCLIDGFPLHMWAIKELTTGTNITLQMTWKAINGTHKISVVADSGNIVSELDETNNERNETLTVSSLPPNAPPVAFIDYINPVTAKWGGIVKFSGHGEDSEGYPAGYWWGSSIDGWLSSSCNFNSSRLSVGEHTIYFMVEDEDGGWSVPTETTLNITQYQAIFSLSGGWNMVSFPVIPANASFVSIFAEISHYQVLTWNGSSYITPTIAEPGKGYWVLVFNNVTVTLLGRLVSNYELDLTAGWSMVGSLCNSTVVASHVFSGSYQLLTWNSEGYVPSTTIEPGKGYWSFVIVPTHIVVSESLTGSTNLLSEHDDTLKTLPAIETFAYFFMPTSLYDVIQKSFKKRPTKAIQTNNRENRIL